MPKLAHSLNRIVIVSIPAFFGDDAPQSCTLVDIDSNGLWLAGEAVSERLATLSESGIGDDARPEVFFPFAQLTYLFDSSSSPARTLLPGVVVAAKTANVRHEATGAEAPDNRYKNSRSKQKRSK